MALTKGLCPHRCFKNLLLFKISFANRRPNARALRQSWETPVVLAVPLPYPENRQFPVLIHVPTITRNARESLGGANNSSFFPVDLTTDPRPSSEN